jgi:integral membrane protein (TIGR01906 family)
MKIFRNTVTAIALMLFIISAAVTITLNFRPLFYFDIDYLDIEAQSGFSKEDIRKNYDALIDYNSMLNHDTLEFPTLPMSEGGRIHFEEVKQIFVAIEYIFIASGIIGLAFLLLLICKFKEFLFLKLAAILTIAIPAVLAILISINWEAAFVTFHHIFFNNDYWLFYPDKDPVILMLPDEFFFHCAAMILILVILGSFISFMIYRILRKKNLKRTA